MSRELCHCRSAIVSIDSKIITNVHGHMVQVQKYGCLNKKCEYYNITIRTTEVAIN